MPSSAYVPLKEAARKHNVDEKVLTQLISAGMIEAKTEAGEVFVLVDKNGNGDQSAPQTKEEIINARFADLRGQSISSYGAQKKFNINNQNFINWARAGIISILNESTRALQLDLADVAYCAYVYKMKKEEYGGSIAGVRLFDDDGNPYQVKYPYLSIKRRK